MDQLLAALLLLSRSHSAFSRQDSRSSPEGIYYYGPGDYRESSNGLIGAIFSGLVALDKDSNAIPELAESWDISSDGKTFTFHIRENATFHSGKQVTARDIKYSWERACDPKNGSPAKRGHIWAISSGY